MRPSCPLYYPPTHPRTSVDGDCGAYRLSSTFAFLPRSVAKPPSALRALAYAEGGVILGPDADPEGWKVYDPIKITGTLFKAREASVQCTVSDPFALPFVGQPAEPRDAAHTQLAVATPVRSITSSLRRYHLIHTHFFLTSSRSRAILLSLCFSPSTARTHKRSTWSPAPPICASCGLSRLAQNPPNSMVRGGAITRLSRAWRVPCSGRTMPAPLLPTDSEGKLLRNRLLAMTTARGLYRVKFWFPRGRSRHSHFRGLLARLVDLFPPLFLAKVFNQAENNKVFHCVSAPQIGWFRPHECTRGSPSDRKRHHNDGERTGRHSELANATQLRSHRRGLQRNNWLP